MTRLPAWWLFPALVGVLGLGIFGLWHLTRRREPDHLQVSADELMHMTHAEFEDFLEASGGASATTAGLATD